MKLKEQMNKQRAYAVKMMKDSKIKEDRFMSGYWRGIMDAMDWVQEGRNEWVYVDYADMPQDKGSAF